MSHPENDYSLVGKCGIALVEFQLTRRGCECVRTDQSSASGDLWAETGIGRISIEVKTSAVGQKWIIRENQTRSEVWVFVTIEAAYCYVLTSDEVHQIMPSLSRHKTGPMQIFSSSFPEGSREGWDKLGIRKAPNMSLMSHIVGLPKEPKYIPSDQRSGIDVVALSKSGLSIRKIERQTGICRSQVSRILIKARA